ncbi:MAG: hypothetical protein R3249_03355 [Nitriliruptorales bacterium]|nr:hypothetical protein [Nitriliruptorales bacterium]
MRRLIRLLRPLSTISLVGALLVAMIAPFASAQELRVEQDFFTGYKAEAFAAPVTIQLFEQLVPIPVDPGKAHLEISANHSNASLNTGPVGLGIGSTTWPGDGIANGLGQLACDESVLWPIMARASYPGEPFEDDAEPGMSATATGLRATGQATGGGELLPGVLSAEGSRSFSLGEVTEDGLSLATAEAVPGRIEMLDGMIVIDGFRTALEATSDGVTAQVSGSQEAGSITIAGTRYVVDSNGIRAEDAEENPLQELLDGDGVPFNLGGVIDFQQLLGVKVEAVPDETMVDGLQAERTIGGVAITLDTGPLKDILNLALRDAQDVLADVISQLPDEETQPCQGPIQGPKGALQFALAITDFRSTFRIIVGRAGVKVSAVQPPVINLPPLPGPPTITPPVAPPAAPGVPHAHVAPPVSNPPGEVPGPVVNNPEPGPVTQPAAVEREFWGGMPWGLIFLVLLLLGLVARGLHAVTIATFGDDAIAFRTRG